MAPGGPVSRAGAPADSEDSATREVTPGACSLRSATRQKNAGTFDETPLFCTRRVARDRPGRRKPVAGSRRRGTEHLPESRARGGAAGSPQRFDRQGHGRLRARPRGQLDHLQGHDREPRRPGGPRAHPWVRRPRPDGGREAESARRKAEDWRLVLSRGGRGRDPRGSLLHHDPHRRRLRAQWRDPRPDPARRQQRVVHRGDERRARVPGHRIAGDRDGVLLREHRHERGQLPGHVHLEPADLGADRRSHPRLHAPRGLLRRHPAEPRQSDSTGRAPGTTPSRTRPTCSRTSAT